MHGAVCLHFVLFGTPYKIEKGDEIKTMLDFTRAKQSFQEYLKDYDLTDDKIHLKYEHTLCVMNAVDYICTHEGLEREDRELALLIALLHDIGRFEQLKTFHSFDDSKFDHAKFGVKVLFADGLIRSFIAEDSYDGIIEKAIAYHSLYALPEGLTEKERLHCAIIRDADKLDNFRVKEVERVETFFDISEQELGEEAVSPVILDYVRSRRSVPSQERVTHMDFWISFLAFIFDLNFPSSFQYLKEENYINRNIDRFPYTNPATRAAMEEVREICLNYVEEHLA